MKKFSKDELQRFGFESMKDFNSTIKVIASDADNKAGSKSLRIQKIRRDIFRICIQAFQDKFFVTEKIEGDPRMQCFIKGYQRDVMEFIWDAYDFSQQVEIKIK